MTTPTLERQLLLSQLVSPKDANALRRLYKGAAELQDVADRYRHVGSNDALINAGRAWRDFAEKAAEALGIGEEETET